LPRPAVPFPIIGVVLILATPHARMNGPALLVGWVARLAVVGAIGLTVASAAGARDGGDPSSGSASPWRR
jgi:hypothetical protein